MSATMMTVLAAALVAALQSAVAVAPAEHGGNETVQESAPAAQVVVAEPAQPMRLRAPRANVTVLTDSGLTSGLKSEDSDVCYLIEKFFQTGVSTTCEMNHSKAVTCVIAKFPECTMEDICHNRNGCGYAQDNAFVKFTGYTCNGDFSLGEKGPEGKFEVSCKPALTPLAVCLIVGAVCVVLACCACLTCLCCRLCRR